MASQHLFGWPEHRPRSYCVLTKKDSCDLSADGLQNLIRLFQRPNIPVSALFCAPQDRFLNVTILYRSFGKQSLAFWARSEHWELFCQDEVECERVATAHKTCRPLQSRFENLLTGRQLYSFCFCIRIFLTSSVITHDSSPGAKKVWLDNYRGHTKVRRTIAKFKKLDRTQCGLVKTNTHFLSSRHFTWYLALGL